MRGQLACRVEFPLLAFGTIVTAKRWSNYSLDAVRIAAGGQGLLRVGKTIFASDQIVEADSPRGGKSNRGRPCIGIAECASDDQLALLDHPKRQPQFICTHPHQDD